MPLLLSNEFGNETAAATSKMRFINMNARMFYRQRVSMLLAFLMVLCLSSCNANNANKPLNIVVDMGNLTYSTDVSKMIEAYKSSNPKTEIITDFIIYSEADARSGFAERNAKVEQIKAAMLSGKGPDVIISFDQSKMTDSSFFNNTRTALIPNPYKSMQADVFLDLTDQLSSNDLIKKINHTFLDASSFYVKTFLLTLSYSIYCLVVNMALEAPYNVYFENSLEVVKRNPALYFDYLSNAQIYFGKSLLDFNSRKVTISSEEAALWVEELYKTSKSTDTANNSDLSILEISSYKDRSDIVSEKTRFASVMGINGNFVSGITGYAGILSNCTNKNIAFEFISHIFNSAELSSYGFCVNSEQNEAQFNKNYLPTNYKQNLQTAQEKISGAYYGNDGSFQLLVSCYPYLTEQAKLDACVSEAMSKMELLIKE
ncbi:MAG: hypothetical protein RR087_04170 [Oscillospiraceae bacterium]